MSTNKVLIGLGVIAAGVWLYSTQKKAAVAAEATAQRAALTTAQNLYNDTVQKARDALPLEKKQAELDLLATQAIINDPESRPEDKKAAQVLQTQIERAMSKRP